jgi:hypothetical protein
MNPILNRQHARTSHKEKPRDTVKQRSDRLEQAQIFHKDVESEVIETAEVRRKQAPTSQKGKSLPVVI